jgi:hypothetical protein
VPNRWLNLHECPHRDTLPAERSQRLGGQFSKLTPRRAPDHLIVKALEVALLDPLYGRVNPVEQLTLFVG